MTFLYKINKKGATAEGCVTASDETEAKAKLEATIADGSALRKLAEMVEAQGGDSRAVYDFSLLPEAAYKREVPSQEGGYVEHIEADDVGLVSMHLGGGRVTKESPIDLSVGVVLHKKVGDRVEPGESLATIHASSEEKAARAEELLRACYTLSPYPVERTPFIKNIVK